MFRQHASVSQQWICSDNCTCCHNEIEVADQTFYLTQSQHTETGPASPCADPITPGAWQDSHWSANFQVTGMTRSGKIPAQAGIELCRCRSGCLNHKASKALHSTESWLNGHIWKKGSPELVPAGIETRRRATCYSPPCMILYIPPFVPAGQGPRPSQWWMTGVHRWRTYAAGMCRHGLQKKGMTSASSAIHSLRQCAHYVINIHVMAFLHQVSTGGLIPVVIMLPFHAVCWMLNCCVPVQ